MIPAERGGSPSLRRLVRHGCVVERERAAERGLPPLPPGGHDSGSGMFIMRQAHARSRSKSTENGRDSWVGERLARMAGRNSSRLVSSRNNGGSDGERNRDCDRDRDRDRHAAVQYSTAQDPLVGDVTGENIETRVGAWVRAGMRAGQGRQGAVRACTRCTVWSRVCVRLYDSRWGAGGKRACGPCSRLVHGPSYSSVACHLHTVHYHYHLSKASTSSNSPHAPAFCCW